MTATQQTDPEASVRSLPQADTALADANEPTITVNSVWKVFGSRPERALLEEYSERDKRDILEELGLVVALQDVSFEVPRSETFVIMGLSGSGKSTMVRCLIRLIEPTTGEICIDG